jgi:hypothetical protein
MLTGFMKRGAEKEVLAIGSMAQEKYFREAVLFNSGNKWKIFHVLRL